ncbi:ISAs1 family transposase [Algivirga pacifica]|uniref:Transposase IS4-like domain-containing protein n=1 Tax=Algivirga pacifica TaxID=1162670 RepID=A0ABP9DDY8_9BACT
MSVTHDGLEGSIVDFYNGAKSSEKTKVQEYLQKLDNLEGKGITLDALHTSKKTLSLIHEKSGVYLCQVKGNQKHLLEDLEHIAEHLPYQSTSHTVEKGHGRIETRSAFQYSVNHEVLDQGWESTGIKTFALIKRETINMKTGGITENNSIYISNNELNAASFQSLCRAHWSVEVNNHTRDTVFGEDHFKSFDSDLQRSVASILSYIHNGMNKMVKSRSIKRLKEDMIYSFKDVWRFFEMC